VKVPHFATLSVNKLYPLALEDPAMKMFLPENNHLKCKRLPDREYFFSLMNTLKGDLLKELIDKEVAKRFAEDEKEGDLE
jgi:hypothetical protein